MLVKPDLAKRLKWAKAKEKLPASHWTHGISFYIDGTGWAHKTRPSQNARTNRTRTWKRDDESLSLHCTAKGKKEGVGGKMARIMVAIAHGKGVVGCQQYTGNITGVMFAEMIRTKFPEWNAKTRDPNVKVFLQDGDPGQTSGLARIAWEELGFSDFTIPARSPDLNPIENIFHLIGIEIKNEGRKIEKETFPQFCHRVKKTVMSFDQAKIDNTIASMPRRIKAVIEAKGARTKY